MKKVCIVSHLSDLSGANCALVRLCTQLKLKKLDFFVLAPRRGLLTDKLDALGISYRIFYYATWIDKINSKKKWIKSIVNFCADIRFILLCIKKRVGVVHYNSVAVGLGAKYLHLLNIPYIWHVREYIDEDIFDFHDKDLLIQCINNARTILYVSKSIKEKYRGWFLNKNYQIIYDGVEIKDRFIYSENDYCNLLVVGGVERNKGQDQAIKAIAGIEGYNVQLYIVGPINDYEYYSELRTIIEKYDMEDRVIFTDYTSNVDHYRQSCGIALICSEYESFGLVTIEAMNVGECVIGADTGGTREILAYGKYGQLYQHGNIEELKKCIINMIESYKMMDEVVINAQVYVENNFSIKKTTDDILRIYESYL